MNDGVRKRFALLSMMAASVLVATSAGAAEVAKRRFDLEAGGGAFITLSADQAPMNDGWYIGGGGAMPLSERFDFECAVGTGRARDSVSNNHRNFVQGSGGVRFYLLGKATNPARLYWSVGGVALGNYRRDGGTDPALYTGPGVRLLAGDHSGLILRLPITYLPQHSEESIMIPSVSWFYQF
jgi:hypothetical protein